MKNKDLRGKGVKPEYGMRYWFDNERHPYILRAFNERYLVLTNNDNLRRGTLLYIADTIGLNAYKHSVVTQDTPKEIGEYLLSKTSNMGYFSHWKLFTFKCTRLEHGKNHIEPIKKKQIEPQMTSLHDAVAYANRYYQEREVRPKPAWIEEMKHNPEHPFHQIIPKTPNYAEIEANLLAVAEVNKDLAKTILINYFQKIGHPWLSVYVYISGYDYFKTPFAYQEGVRSEIFIGIGKLLGIDTANWEVKSDNGGQRIINIISKIFV